MGLNVEDPKVISQAIDQATQNVKSEIVPALQAAIAASVDKLRDDADTVIAGATESLGQATAAQVKAFFDQAHELLDRLNGTVIPIKANGVTIAQMELQIPNRKETPQT